MGKPSEDDDGDDVIEVSDGGSNADEGDEAEDRGDVVNPEETEEALKKLADEEEEEPEAEEAPAKSTGAIPKPRFDEVNEKRIRAEERARIAEEELARVRSGKATEEPKTEAIDLKDLRKQQRAALMEGDEDKAAELDDKIDAEMERRATERATQTITQANAKQALADAAAAVVVDYPFLDSTSKAANKEAIEAVVAFRNTFVQQGMSYADALLKAADMVGKFYAPKKAAAKAADEDEEPTEKTPKSKIDELKAARLRKNASAANNQPARLDGGVGNRGTGGKLNIEEMDDDTFKSLSEKDKAKLRGDVA